MCAPIRPRIKRLSTGLWPTPRIRASPLANQFAKSTSKHAEQIKLCISDCNQNRAIIRSFGQLVTTPASQSRGGNPRPVVTEAAGRGAETRRFRRGRGRWLWNSEATTAISLTWRRLRRPRAKLSRMSGHFFRTLVLHRLRKSKSLSGSCTKQEIFSNPRGSEFSQRLLAI